jgi:lipid-A-disaccharide synthase-like uncharacterized protein
MNEWFTSPAAWTALGFAGQLMFSCRFLVQWWSSERHHRVMIPRAFWYFSLLGGFALFVYAWHRRDPVFALGQAAGLFIYARNLTLARGEAAA